MRVESREIALGMIELARHNELEYWSGFIERVISLGASRAIPESVASGNDMAISAIHADPLQVELVSLQEACRITGATASAMMSMCTDGTVSAWRDASGRIVIGKPSLASLFTPLSKSK